ncbi:hypothetical protein FCU94_14510 [Vibrio sp. JPW-9-11-11]|nr:hypothetical protein [Vibrio sp. JPW-9-11-11]
MSPSKKGSKQIQSELLYHKAINYTGSNVSNVVSKRIRASSQSCARPNSMMKLVVHVLVNFSHSLRRDK